MNYCDLVLVGEVDGRLQFQCSRCNKRCKAPRSNLSAIPTMRCGTVAPMKPDVTSKEKAELFPDVDPALIGERIAALTSAVGIPPCAGCGKRREWFNKAHAWARTFYGPIQ